MPRTDLPRFSIGLTFSQAQLDRMDEMIERYNERRDPNQAAPIMTHEQLIAGGLVAFEAMLFDLQSPGSVSIFEEPR
jgi:hypothetical protein